VPPSSALPLLPNCFLLVKQAAAVLPAVTVTIVADASFSGLSRSPTDIPALRPSSVTGVRSGHLRATASYGDQQLSHSDQ
jgi:hypothetical protein